MMGQTLPAQIAGNRTRRIVGVAAWLWLAVALWIVWPTTASASPSFLCTAKLTGIEKAVCGDEDLSASDSVLSQLYAKLKASLSPDAREALVAEQRHWLADRVSQCPDNAAVDCLRRVYFARIQQLESRLGLLQGGYVAPPDYQVALVPGSAALFSGMLVQCQADAVALAFPWGDDRTPVIANRLAGRGDLQAAFADCTLADGSRVRVKAGLTSTPMAYGQCGASPAYQLSVWVDGRKVVSALQYTNFCEEPVLSSLSLSKDVARFCRRSDADTSGLPVNAFKPTQGACGTLPYAGGSAVDRAEFPLAGTSTTSVGTLKVEASGPIKAVCEQIVAEQDIHGLHIPKSAAAPDWQAQHVDLPQPDFGSLGYNATTLSADRRVQVASFDLTNTGNASKVYWAEQGNHWFDGSAFGLDRTDILVTPFDAHDWDKSVPKGIYPFTYEHAQVFFFQGKTYLLLDPVNALVDPRVVMLHGSTLTTECTLHRQQEHF